MYKKIELSELIGQTIVSLSPTNKGVEEVVFRTSTGRSFRMFHYQDCCETVTLEDVVGDVADLIGTPILSAEEAENQEDKLDIGKSTTWTFYHLRTIRGTVTLRWYGTSNGYYSEYVDFEEITGDEDDH